MCHLPVFILAFADQPSAGRAASSMTSPSNGKLSHGKLMKIWLVFILGVGTFIMDPVQTSFIRFKADTEYIYNFHSSTDLRKVETLLAESKVMVLKTLKETTLFKLVTLNRTSISDKT